MSTQPKMASVREITMLARMVPFEDAVKLIEEYARTAALSAACDAATQAHNRILCAIEAGPSHARP